MELQQNKNICSTISNYIAQIRGLRKTSASPSDVWFITFKHGVVYDKIPVDKAVMKVFFSDDVPFGDGQEELEDNTIGLNYEERVYRKIINPLLDHVCPFFIRLFTSTQSCSYDNMIKLLQAEFGDRKNAEARFDRIFKMIWRQSGRPKPSINDTLDTLESYELLKSLKYSYIVLREFTPKHKSMYEYIQAINFQLPLENNVNFWLVLFQMAVGLYAMELSKLVHNDFHHQNCIIETLDGPHTRSIGVTYSKETWYYEYTSNIRTVIFDFDRAYSPQLGPNESLPEKCGGWAGYQCSKFVKGRDAMQMFCYILRFMKEAHATIPNLMLVASQLTTITNFNELSKFNDENRFCTTKNVPPIFPLSVIIFNLAEKAKIKITRENILPAYHLDPADFSPTGNFLQAKS